MHTFSVGMLTGRISNIKQICSDMFVDSKLGLLEIMIHRTKLSWMCVCVCVCLFKGWPPYLLSTNTLLEGNGGGALCTCNSNVPVLKQVPLRDSPPIEVLLTPNRQWIEIKKKP